MTQEPIAYEYDPNDAGIDDDDATIYDRNGVLVMVRGIDGHNCYEVRALSGDSVLVNKQRYPGEGQLRSDMRPEIAKRMHASFAIECPIAGELVLAAFRELGWMR